MKYFRKYRFLFFALIGGVAGYSYYYFVGCNGGCLITGNPYISTIYGSLVGFILGIPNKRITKNGNETNN